MVKQSILIVEDEAIIRTALRKLLQRRDYDVSEAKTVREAQKNYHFENFNLIISDLRLPGPPGTDLIGLAGDTPVLIMTSYASLRSAVESIRLGAVDYIAKPFDHDEMLATVEQVISSQEQLQKRQIPLDSNEQIIDGMVGKSQVMQALTRQILKIAPSNATVLVHGETGTGKELVARALHDNSDRAGKPLISVNCAAIPETLIEAELFGHEKGAFTGAATAREGLITAADGGTLFLDEIGELPLEAQARLLRVLQEGEVRPIGSIQDRKVDVRLIAATHRNLRELSQQGKFREDLFYRINVMQVNLPPLRERGKDVLLIAEYLLQRFANEANKTSLNFSPEAVQLITSYRWPGNIRELENSVQRATILSEHDSISHQLLGIDLELHPIEEISERPNNDTLQFSSAFDTSSTSPPQQIHNPQPAQLPISEASNLSLEDYFQCFVLENQGTMSETALAKKLGVSRKCLWERRQKLGIPRKKVKE